MPFFTVFYENYMLTQKMVESFLHNHVVFIKFREDFNCKTMKVFNHLLLKMRDAVRIFVNSECYRNIHVKLLILAKGVGITTTRLRTFRLRHFVYRHFVYRYFRLL